MCGIFGAVAIGTSAQPDFQRFEHALALQAHRGPDALRSLRVADGVLFGHARLSIIDLDPRSHQPMTLGGRYWITYNGEIFNYIELRGELEAAGASFTTLSDTEVILHAYARWGEDCVSRFNGMWAFAIHDRDSGDLFCSRDRFGEKPFLYSHEHDEFLFASELKSIVHYRPGLAEPEHNTIANFCRTSVGAQQPQSWFRRIHRLQPGHNLTLQHGRIRLRRYWHYPEATTDDTDSPGMDFGDARERYRNLFNEAVRIRLRSDVPLGLTLSSGIDSSSIACSMHSLDPKPHHFFCSTFVNNQRTAGLYRDAGTEVDESVGAGQLARELGQHFHTVSTDYSRFTESLADIVYHLESGNSSPAVLPLMQLHREARRYVKVVLEGQGADELLAGYVANVLWPAIFELVRAGRLAEALKSLRRFGQSYHHSYSAKMLLRGWSNRLHLLSRLHQRFSGTGLAYGPLLRDYERQRDYPDLGDEGSNAPLARILREQHSGTMVNLLHYGDAISMAHGLESRMPFLDYRLVEFVWKLPADFKIRLGIGKFVHRQAMRDLVPDRILDQPLKFGFNSPISQQFRSGSSSGIDPIDVLLDRRCLERGLFDRRGLQAVIDAHRQTRADHGPLLFRLLSTELWFRRFIDAGPLEAIAI